MVEKYLSESDIKKLLQCSRCKRVPVSPPVYMCKTGHHECSVCYEKHLKKVSVEETDGSSDSESESGSPKKRENGIGVIFPRKNKKSYKHKCALCKDEVTKTRNFLAEYLINQLEMTKNENRLDKPGYLSSMKINVQETKVQTNYVDCCYNIYGSPYQRYEAQHINIPPYDPQSCPRYQVSCPTTQYNLSMDPYIVTATQPQIEYSDPNVYYPEYENIGYYNCMSRKEMNERRSKFNFNNQCSVVSLTGESSKRPIRCPTHLCGRNIAVAALSSHFCFDHPEVPPLNVDIDVSCHLFIDPEMIPFNYGRCIAMLLIPNKCDSIGGVSHPSIMSVNKVKNSVPLVVMASRLYCTTSSQLVAASISKDSQTESLNHGDFQTIGNGKSQLLLIWLAGVDMSPSMYTTIQVTEKQTNMRSIIYTGPITSLRASQNTNKVFEQGDCLVIHLGILENIVSDKGGFDLHVMKKKLTLINAPKVKLGRDGLKFNDFKTCSQYKNKILLTD